MKRLIALGFALGLADAQTNLQYMQPWFDSLKQGTEMAMRSRELDEVRRHNMAAESLIREQLRAEYRERHNNAADWRINQDMKDAVNACRALHEDCEALGPLMSIIGDALRPDWSKLTMTEYVESLYAVARTASFAEPARKVALGRLNSPPK